MNDQIASIHGIVLAGAFPCCPLCQLVPRPLLPVALQPLVTFALRWMASGGLRGATICGNTTTRAIRARLNESAFGLRLDYLEDWNPRGPAGCVRDAGLRTDACTFVVADGTAVPVLDLAEVVEGHRASGAEITVVVGAEGGAGRLRPSGVYVFDRRSFARIPKDGFQDIKEMLIPHLYAAGGQVSTCVAHEVAPRVINIDTYLALNQWVIERACRHRHALHDLSYAGETVRHSSASVDPTARLLGPVLLGPGVSVQEDASLVGPVIVGPGTTVCPGAVVSRSVIWSECVVGERSFLDRSMLADHVIVEPGSWVTSAMKTTTGCQETVQTARHPARARWAPLAAAPSPSMPNNT